MSGSRSKTTSVSATKTQRKMINTCAAYLATLSSSQHSASAFSPLVPASTPPSLVNQRAFGRASASTASLVTTTTTGRNLYVNNFKLRPTPSSLVSRSAVIQSYRVEDDAHVAPSDAFSFLPSRLSTIQRIENPSQFQSHVLNETNALVVVRFTADACPTCRATGSLFRRWSRDLETLDQADSWTSSNSKLKIKIVEMPLNKANSSFMQDQLNVEQIPYCHLYHPQLGLVEEQLVMNKLEFSVFVDVVDNWAKGLSNVEYDSCVLCAEGEKLEDCEEFC